jgi:hypothetical protein
LNNIDITVDILLRRLNMELKKFRDKNKASLSEVFKFTPKIMMNLLLNFESFDQTTKIKDVYMPEEKIINFNVGYLKLNFKGKLRLTADREKSNNNVDKVAISDGPSNTYGVVEDRDLFIKFDKPVVVKYLYIRAHDYGRDTSYKYKNNEMNISGYKKEQMIFSTRMNFHDHNWVSNQYIIYNQN